MTLGMVSSTDVHAGVYARQSLARENKSEASTETQIEAGCTEAARRGASAVEKYVDLGKSAFKEGVVRPDFDRLIADCRAGRINMIIVYYISRFSRMEPLDAIPIVTELLNLGVTIVSVTEGEFRKGNLMDLIHMIMRLDAAHNESKNKSAAVGSAKRAAKALGGYVGGRPPYGFDLVPDTRTNAAGRPVVVQTLRQNAEQCEVIRRVWRTIKLHLATPFRPGKPHPGSLSGICKALSAEGTPWTVQHMRRVLRDPRIAGFEADAVYGETAAGTTTRKARAYSIRRDPDTLDPIVFDSAPILDPAEWYQLQAWLDGRGQGKGLARAQALLSGIHTPLGDAILRCECGKPMSARSTAGKRNSPAYRCTRAGAAKPGEHAGTNTVAQSYLDDYVARRIFALIDAFEADPDDTTADILAEVTKRFARTVEAPETAGERVAILADRADAVDALNGIADGLAAARSDIVRGRLMAQEAIAAERLEKLDARLTRLDELAAPALPLSGWTAEEGDPIGPGSWWHAASVSDRREFVALFCQRITISKAKTRHAYGNAWSPTDLHKRAEIEWAR